MSGRIPARAISAWTATPSRDPRHPAALPVGWPTGIHFIQPEFEAMLRRAVARHGNVEVLLAHELVDLADLGDSIALTVRNSAGADPPIQRDVSRVSAQRFVRRSSGSTMKTSPSTSGGSSWMCGSGGPRRCPR